ncbi:hypothetical protein NKH18_12485 [Streptomyces sp. M10(2022)]
MSLADLTFEHWRVLDGKAAARYGEEAARQVDGRLVRLDSTPHGGAALHRAVVERAGNTSR